MRAVFLNRYGSPDVLEYGELPKPQVHEGQVLIQVHAAGVNPIDWRIRKGQLRWLWPARFPLVPGRDVSGVVTEVGPGVSEERLGEEVYCYLDQGHGGGYAQYAVASASVVVEKPTGLTHEEAAGIPLAASTALQSLRNLGHIAEGNEVLINGASGGVGTFAVQIARAMGAVVTGVCSRRNLDLVRELGADHVVDYTSQDFTRDARRYDIVFDAVAKSSFVACRRILKPRGCYVTTVPMPHHVFFDAVTRVCGRRRCATMWAHSSGDDLRYIKQLVESGQVRSLVEQCFALQDARQAHRAGQAGRTRGKLVLRVREDGV